MAAVPAEDNGNGVGWGWAVLGGVIGGGSRRQPAQRRDEPNQRNVFASFSFPIQWMEMKLNWRKEKRDEIEEKEWNGAAAEREGNSLLFD